MRNLGIAKSTEKAISLCHGVLCVGQDGDDVALPNRVARIVEAWENDGRRATVVVHEYYEMVDDRIVGRFKFADDAVVAERGAVMAFSPRVVSDFPPIEEIEAWDDWVMGNRGVLLGPLLMIREPLLNYRLGGMSTTVGGREWFNKTRSGLYRRRAAARQMLMDRNMISPSDPDLYSKWIASFEVSDNFSSAFFALTEGPLMGRVRAYCKEVRSNGCMRLLGFGFFLPPFFRDWYFRLYFSMVSFRH